MRILFIHQNFPGQYRLLVEWLRSRGEHEIVFVTRRKAVPKVNGITFVRYKPHRTPRENSYTLSKEFESNVGAGYGVALVCEELKQNGFVPDIVIGHTGWGELLFVKDIWPDVPLIGYFEYFHISKGGLLGFDPEFTNKGKVRPFIVRARNAANYMSVATVDLAHCPTRWQLDTYPKEMHHRFYRCHDGIRTDKLRPAPDATLELDQLDRTFSRDDEVLTYVGRSLEPVRGFHIFMRSLPKILEARPNAHVLIAGREGRSYSEGKVPEGGYRASLEKELGDNLDWSRVHFLGELKYPEYVKLLQLSRCHTYLTVPFVLSWSLLEAMSLGTTIVASDTAPIREVLSHGRNALLFDYFSPDELADRVIDVLGNPDEFAHLGEQARKDVVANYDFLTKTLPIHISRINSLVPKEKHIKLSGE